VPSYQNEYLAEAKASLIIEKKTEASNTLCWGIGQKTFTLETSKYRICECTSGWKVCFITWKYSWRNNADFVQFVNSLTLCEMIAELTFGLQVGCLFQSEWNLVKSGSRESTNFGNLTNSWRHELANFGNIRESHIRKSWWMSICMNEAARINRRPSQRRHLKKSGFEVWTSGRLVNVWN
jgi:hypothetical protein